MAVEHSWHSGTGPVGGEQLRFNDARYIKLGKGGTWERVALARGTLEWDGDVERHALAEKGDWTGVKAHYIASGKPPSTATAYTRELRDLCESGSTTLWVTFSGGYLFWTTAEGDVIDRGPNHEPDRGRFYRHTLGPWRKHDLAGADLRMTDLSTKLTQLAAYRQSVCSVSDPGALFRIIRGERGGVIKAANDARVALATALLPLIQQLHQNEFELFVDLLFTASGWRRRSVLGGNMKTVDLQLELPATGERAVVQVKSAATQAVAKQCIAAMREGWPDDRAFFIYHTGKGSFQDPLQDEQAQVLDVSQLAGLAIDHGLVPWLLGRGR